MLGRGPSRLPLLVNSGMRSLRRFQPRSFGRELRAGPFFIPPHVPESNFIPQVRTRLIRSGRRLVKNILFPAPLLFFPIWTNMFFQGTKGFYPSFFLFFLFRPRSFRSFLVHGRRRCPQMVCFGNHILLIPSYVQFFPTPVCHWRTTSSKFQHGSSITSPRSNLVWSGHFSFFGLFVFSPLPNLFLDKPSNVEPVSLV